MIKSETIEKWVKTRIKSLGMTNPEEIVKDVIKEHPKLKNDDRAIGRIVAVIKNLEEKQKRKNEKVTKEKILSTSFYERDGVLYEQIHCLDGGSMFAVWDGSKVEYTDRIDDDNSVIIPIIDDDALKEGAVLLPTGTEDYGNLESLIKEIKEHVHTYVDVSEDYETFSVFYILLSWVYDKINTLCYMRTLGDTGTGKSRFQNVVGRLCYKPCIVSGSITPAPIYRMIKRWKGTIILDEADFRESSEKNEVITILNCGFEKGRPVIRCYKENPDDLQFLPTFCPKIIATRRTFNDKALESRCLTEIMKETDRNDISVILPKKFFDEEAKLRNKLLMFRFDWRSKIDTETVQGLDLGDIEPRLKQATSSFAILFFNMPELMKMFKEFLQKYNRELIEERATSFEGMIVNSINSLLKNSDIITPSDITEKIENDYGGKKPSPQTVGKYLKSLGLKTTLKRISEDVKRVLDIDEKIWERLKRRYITPLSSVTNVTNDTSVTEQDENVTVVTDVTNVTKSQEEEKYDFDKELKKIADLKKTSEVVKETKEEIKNWKKI
jgi:hypothetical protein